MAEAPIYIDDTPGIKITEIRARSRKLSQEVEGGLDLIVIDYLQLITGTRPENRQQRGFRYFKTVKNPGQGAQSSCNCLESVISWG